MGADPTHYTPLTSPKSYLYSITIRCFHTNGIALLFSLHTILELIPSPFYTATALPSTLSSRTSILLWEKWRNVGY